MFTVKDLLDAYCGTHHYNKVIFVEVGSSAPCEGSITYEEAMYKEYGHGLYSEATDFNQRVKEFLLR